MSHMVWPYRMGQSSNKYEYLLRSMVLINFLGIYLNATLRYEYNYMFQTWNFKSFPKQTHTKNSMFRNEKLFSRRKLI